MTTTRRTFMRQVGVTLAGLLAAGCDTRLVLAPPAGQAAATATSEIEYEPTCYEAPAATEAPVPEDGTPTVDIRRWRDVRACWLDLANRRLADAGNTAYAQLLRGRHQLALAALVGTQALDQDVANHIGVAFEEAVQHIQAKQATCYAPLPEGAANPYPPREEVVTQAAALAEMAERSAISAETVAAAQAALARDMAWLEQFRAGGNPGEVTGLEATPAEVEAARVLVALLAETQ